MRGGRFEHIEDSVITVLNHITTRTLPALPLNDQRVAVIGLGASGLAASHLLLRQGARVVALDAAEGEALRAKALELERLGARVCLGACRLPEETPGWGVLSPGVSPSDPILVDAAQRKVPVIGELELGYRYCRCPIVAITGTNGKTTTTELMEALLKEAGRRTVAAGNIGLPLCSVAEQSSELDWLAVEVSSFQLETIQFFRPAIALLLNLTPDHLDRYAGMEDYIRAKAGIFQNQQPFDWAILRKDAWQQLVARGLAPRSKCLTFSADDASADLYRKGECLFGNLARWENPLLDMTQGRLRGVHNAENMMAVLAAAWIMGLPQETVRRALLGYQPAPHRCELVAEIDGVRFVNDSKATNVDAVRRALQSMPGGDSLSPHVLLIAGGKDKGFGYSELGPLLAQRVKRAFLLGETQRRIQREWEPFTACTPVPSLPEAVWRAASLAAPGDVVLLSPACSSFDMFRNYQHRGEVFRQAVHQWGAGRKTAPPLSTPVPNPFRTEAKSVPTCTTNNPILTSPTSPIP